MKAGATRTGNSTADASTMGHKQPEVDPTKQDWRANAHAAAEAIWHFAQKINRPDLIVVVLGLLLAVAIRIPLLDFKSLDYYASLKPWYNTIKSQGFSAFATNFSTYNPPYLYLLYLLARFFPDIPAVIAVKIPGLIGDFICAFFVYLIVRAGNIKGFLSYLAGFAVLFAPTVVLNSAFWGQADSLFTAGLVASLFFLMTRRHGLALFAFGAALSFKLQAIFLTPALLALFARRIIHWKYLLLVPSVLLLAWAPAWAAGRPITELVNIYLFQTSQFESLTMNAPSVYAWLPASKQVFNLFYLPGVITGVVAAFMLLVVIYKSPNEIISSQLIELALLSVLVVPFFLPKMHERYFYPADVISIALAFYVPRLFYMPLLVGGASFLAYQPYLFGADLVPMPVLTLMLLAAISTLFYHVMTLLYSAPRSEPLSPAGDPGGA